VQVSAAARAKTLPPMTGVDSSVKMLDPATERSLLAYMTLNKLLQNFIDHVSYVCLSALKRGQLWLDKHCVLHEAIDTAEFQLLNVCKISVTGL